MTVITLRVDGGFMSRWCMNRRPNMTARNAGKAYGLSSRFVSSPHYIFYHEKSGNASPILRYFQMNTGGNGSFDILMAVRGSRQFIFRKDFD